MDGRTPWERSLGGSESAMIFAARALAARGHHVSVFTRCDAPGVYDDVTYFDIGALDNEARLRDFDVFVSLRFPDLVEKDVRAGLRVLWSQDVLHEMPVEQCLSWCDLLVFVSAWHEADTLRRCPGIAGATAVVPNSVDLALIPPPPVDPGPPLLVHLSRPERGLRPLLAAWPSIHARFPSAQLAVARYLSFHEPAGGHVEAFCRTMDDAVRRMPGCSHLGNLSKPELYALLTNATAMVYPAEFDETSCIAAIEAQACGAPVVAVRRGALPETLAPDACVLVEPGPEMVRRFSDRVVELLWDAELRGRLSAAGREHARRFDVGAVAEQWEQLFVSALRQKARPAARVAASAGRAMWPGLGTSLWRAVIAQLGPGTDVVLIGDGALPLPGREVRPPSERPGDVVLDLGTVLQAEDRRQHLLWLATLGRRVVHVLPQVPDALAAQRVVPDYDDIVRWFGDQAEVGYTLEADCPWGAPARCWIVSYAAGAVPAEPDRPARKGWASRRTPTVSACLMVRDAAETILTTLDSLLPIADEVRVMDTGSRDHTLDLVQSFAKRAGRPVVIREVPWPDDFGLARNLSVDGAGGDWVLWIDADERLIGAERLRRLLQTEHWHAYAIRQHNHIFDAGMTHVEIPFRVYRNHQGYKFFGSVHEHPERELNEPITPWTVAPGVEILHYGYLTEAVRTRKLMTRNLRLLNLDFERYPGRKLTDVLYLRDCVNLARYDLRASGAIRPDHVACLEAAVLRFEDECMTERGRFYHLGREYYDAALGLLGQGAEIFVAVGAEDAQKKKHRFRRLDDAAWLALSETQAHVTRVLGGGL